MRRIKIESKLPNNKKGNKSNHLVYDPFSINFKLNLSSLLITKQLLIGTDSKEWLTLAEDKVYKNLKNGNKN